MVTNLGRDSTGPLLRGPLLFLVYINDLPKNLESVVKLLADDTSLFPTVHKPLISAEITKNDLIKISEWTYQWEISFNPDPTKQEKEVIFSRESKKTDHPRIHFNDFPVGHTNCQRHLGM